MLIRLLIILILIIISLFCWLSLLNPVEIDFHFFGEIIHTGLDTLMISSFVLGVLLVFSGHLDPGCKAGLQRVSEIAAEEKRAIFQGRVGKGDGCLPSG